MDYMQVLMNTMWLTGTCGDFPTVEHAHPLISQNSSPSAVLYTCEPGFTPRGSTLIKCVHGRWTTPHFKCYRSEYRTLISGVTGLMMPAKIILVFFKRITMIHVSLNAFNASSSYLHRERIKLNCFPISYFSDVYFCLSIDPFTLMFIRGASEL